MYPDDLGEFLRSRRESVRPSDVGLPEGGRRRTPGLRRAELATLAGISVDYLIRLEQGRDRRPSAQVLAAIADVLRLDDDDRAHLRVLASVTHGAELCPELSPPAQAVRSSVQAVLDRLEPSPAYVLNTVGDVIAWTAGYEALARDLGILDASPPNVIRFTFQDRRARGVYPDWSAVADEQVANLRAASRPDDASAQGLIGDLLGEPAFAERWQARIVALERSGSKRISHPQVGGLRVRYETLLLPDADEQRLVVYLPADDATASALDLLAGRRPGALRPVMVS